ncbi:ATP-dependent DNA helicase RecQ [Coprinopsis cinerea AmutBmut pab1-1]|nr:ATP-dependent DNA helicase RecQ [Coprinopsis cinerea AmutBmut pab1-1]
MSELFLDETYKEFTAPNGGCRILIMTSSNAVGVDFPNVKIVCNVGLPSTVVNLLQRGGHAIRTGNEQALFIIFYEPWVMDIDLNNYNGDDTDIHDPDRPRVHARTVGKISVIDKKDCVPFILVKLVQQRPSLIWTGSYCCNCGDHLFLHPLDFDLQSLLPGPLFVDTDMMDVDKATGSSSGGHGYHRLVERPYLEHALNKWLEEAHRNDPLTFA